MATVEYCDISPFAACYVFHASRRRILDFQTCYPGCIQVAFDQHALRTSRTKHTLSSLSSGYVMVYIRDSKPSSPICMYQGRCGHCHTHIVSTSGTRCCTTIFADAGPAHTFEVQAEPAANTFIWLGLPCITSLANRRRIVHYLSAVLDLSIAELLYYVTSVTLGAGTNPVDCMTGAHRSHKSLYLLSSPTWVL